MAERMTDERLKSARLALEGAWVTVFAFAGGCWDSLDDIEEGIAEITGETTTQVNKRLFAKHKRFIKSRNKGQDATRQRAKAELAKLRTQNADLVKACEALMHEYCGGGERRMTDAEVMGMARNAIAKGGKQA